MTDSVVQAHELTKHYHHSFFWWQVKAKAVTGLTLQIERGQIFGLLGPNGSGKSTTIKLLLGLIFPSSGYVTVFGKKPQSRDVKHRIGYLPEESYLYRTLDAEETLDFYARLFGLGRQERQKRVHSLLDLVGLSHARHRPVLEFSKGMQRRIGLAQCLISDPEFVILDEPTSGLDPIGTAEFKDLIRQLRDKGKTVLLCSHLLSDVEDVCDHACILHRGQKIAEGSIEELVQDNKHSQITATMSQSTMSRVQEIIKEEEGSTSIVDAGPSRRRLESYFLDIIERAQSENSPSQKPAQMGQSLDFLTENKRGQAALEQLAQSPSKSTTETAAAPPKLSETTPPQEPLLSELAGPQTKDTTEAPKESTPSPSEVKDARNGGPDLDLLKNLSQGESGS